MKNKKVLITGAAGFIGSHLTEELLNQCSQVSVLVKYNSRNDLGNIKHLKKHINIFNGDIIDSEFVRRAIKDQDIVFHLAALIGIPYSFFAPNMYVNTNIIGTLNVLNVVKEFDIEKLVNTSTSEVFGGCDYDSINELHPLNAKSVYAATKIASDQLCCSYFCSFGVPVVNARPFNTYGPRQSLRAVIPNIISQALNGNVIKLGNVDTIRDFNYVKDTVSGFIACANSEDKYNGNSFNFGSGKAYTIKNIVKIIGDCLQKELIIDIDDTRKRILSSEVMKLKCDNVKINECLGWKTKYDIKSGLLETIKYMKKSRGACEYVI